MASLFGTLKKDLSRVKKLSPDRKFVLWTLFAVVFLASVVVGGVFFPGGTKLTDTQQPTESQPQPTPRPITTLSLSPFEGELSVGKSTTVSVMLDELPVTAADIVITYNPKEVSLSKATNGKVFTRIIRNKVKEGKLSYSASVSLDDPDDVQTGEVFTFTITPQAGTNGTSVTIAFDPIETITAIDGENTLGTTVSGVYTIE